MDSGKVLIQQKLESYLIEKTQNTLSYYLEEKIVNPYIKIRCSLVSEINIKDSDFYFRCNYRKGINYPKTGECASCPLKDTNGIWINSNINVKERKEFLENSCYGEPLCFEIK